jgi:hypothetical protein
MFIYRDEVYHAESPEKGIAEIIISKQRNGPVGTIKLAFLGATTSFAPLVTHYDDSYIETISSFPQLGGAFGEGGIGAQLPSSSDLLANFANTDEDDALF